MENNCLEQELKFIIEQINQQVKYDNPFNEK